MIPDPLHPAIVHFPIVLVLLGTFAILASIFFLKKPMAISAAIFFVLASASAYFAVETGGEAADAFLEHYSEATPILDQHATWGERSWHLSIAVAVMALITAFASTYPKAFTIFRVLTFFAALGLSWSIYKTAYLGGEMVYEHALKISDDNHEDED